MNRIVLAGTVLALTALVTVIDGEEVDRDDFPATCQFKAEGARPCTCVLVGSEALLTAAHCLGDNDRTGNVGIFGQPAASARECRISADLDLAICRVSPVGGLSFERISSVPLEEGDGLLLTGFGCSSPLQPHSTPTLRMDPARVRAFSESDNFIEIEEGRLCDGDSGGPAFSLGSADHFGPRLVIGINSRDSRITSVSTLAARQFIERWADDSNVGVCGVRESRNLPCR